MDDIVKRYVAAGHRVQSGIAFLIGLGLDKAAASPKQLRTGLDLRAADAKGLADLLISKGVFTKEEYMEAMTKSAEEEAERYEAEVSKEFGHKVTLG